jgi:SAM-dependent methyltransferase
MNSLSLEHIITKAVEEPERYFLWSSELWRRAVPYWAENTSKRDFNSCQALEVGAASGGLSLMLSDLGAQVTCSDLSDELPQARAYLKQKAPGHNFKYAAIDLLNPLPQKFDIIVCKSVITSVVIACGKEAARTAIENIRAALNPGGEFWFVENLPGGSLHRAARNLNRSYSRNSPYLSKRELESNFDNFSELEMKTFGLCSPFFPGSQFLQKAASNLDSLVLERILPETANFLTAGVAKNSNGGTA